MDHVDDIFGQAGSRVRCDWGMVGAEAIAGAPAMTAIVVVDVLSFTTSVSIACDRGIEVLPYRWRDDRVREFAREQNAVVAEARSERDVSLSPTSLATATGIDRVVLPSPNGSTISLGLRERGHLVIAGCLRNASAVARWCAAYLASDPDRSVAFVMAGERWAHDGSLRPAVEDLWGAGAAIRGLAPESLSTEARVAVTAFDAVESGLLEAMNDCVSGRELRAAGFDADLRLAADLDVSTGIPLLGAGSPSGESRSFHGFTCVSREIPATR